jgi:hypothetical protein
MDARCAMELDEINPEKWAALEAATNEYIVAEDAAFNAAAAALCSRLAAGSAFQPTQQRLGEEENGCLAVFVSGSALVSAARRLCQRRSAEDQLSSCRHLQQ